MKPLVSVIIPCYNQEKYIGKCLASVIDQTFTSWEAIIVDDASNDKTTKIINEITKNNKKIKLISHKKNWGIKNLDKTYNQALKISEGNLIAILEGDDSWPINKLQNQISVFKDSKTVLSFGDCIMTDLNGKGISLVSYDLKRNLKIKSAKIINLFFSLKFYLMSPTVMIRKSALLRIGGFKKDKNYPFIDIPTYIHLALEGNFAYIKRVLGYYRKSPSSAWFYSVKKTKNMGKESVKNCINNFLSKKKIKINKKDLLEQRKYLSYKNEHKEISEALHYLFFNDTRSLKQISKRIFKTSANPKNRFIAFLLFNFPLLVKNIIYLNFSIRFFFYKIRIICSF